MRTIRCVRARRVAAMVRLLRELAGLRFAVFGNDDEAEILVEQAIDLARPR